MRAGHAVALGAAESDRDEAVGETVAAIAIERLPRWAHASLGLGVVGELDAGDFGCGRLACNVPLQVFILSLTVFAGLERRDRSFAMLDLDNAWKPLPDNRQLCAIAFVLRVR